jgi:multiple antibiotic resistance protein
MHMDMTFTVFVGWWIKFFFLLTPFFSVSVYLSLTAKQTPSRRRRIALKATVSMVLICVGLFFFGNPLFRVLGITVDSFRVGAGVLLFLVALDSVRGRSVVTSDHEEVSVVPLAVPVAVGPGTIGTLLVLGSDSETLGAALLGCLALVCAVCTLGGMFFAAQALERYIHKDVLAVLSKLTGLVLAAFAAQLIFTGVRNLLAG